MPDPPVSPPLVTHARVHALVMLSSAALSLALGTAWPAAGAGAISLALAAFVLRERLTPTGAFGAANALTLARIVLTVLALPGSAPPGPFAALLVLAVFALDGLDGWLARKRGESSAFGAHFDLEADALLVLLCALVLYQHGRLGAFVLLPGGLRYLFVLLLALLAAAPEAPRSRFGRHAFSLLVVSLAASLWPIAPFHRALAAAASALVAGSFARSLYFALRPSAARARAGRAGGR